MKPKIVIITGPTASGKTELSLNLARWEEGEIISADSMQIYRKMNIGTAKASPEQRQKVPHHLIDVVEPDEPFTVADFKKKADAAILSIVGRGKTPYIVGGTGLYINSLVTDWQYSHTPPNVKVRRQLEEEAEKKGGQALFDLLLEVDEVSARKTHPNNVKRVIRALEVYYTTGRKKSDLDQASSGFSDQYDVVMIGLTTDRSLLYERIEKRVDQMMEEGLYEEVEQLIQQGFSPALISMQGLGYKEMAGVVNREYPLEEGVRLLKRNTRRFAKRQLTWFRRYDFIHWIDIMDGDKEKRAREIVKKHLKDESNE